MRGPVHPPLRVVVLAVVGAALALTLSSAGSAARPSPTHAARALACGASAGAEPSTFDAWCGTWQVHFHNDTVGGTQRVGPFGDGSGTVTFRRISQDEGAAANGQDFGAFPFRSTACDARPLFYRGRFDWGGGGDVIACTAQQGARLEGRYRLDRLQGSNCCGIVQSGSFSTVGGNTSFVGDYSVDNSNQSSFQWSGVYEGGGVDRLNTSCTVRAPRGKVLRSAYTLKWTLLVAGVPNVYPRDLIGSALAGRGDAQLAHAPTGVHRFGASIRGSICHEDLFAATPDAHLRLMADGKPRVFRGHDGSLTLTFTARVRASDDPTCPPRTTVAVHLVDRPGTKPDRVSFRPTSGRCDRYHQLEYADGGKTRVSVGIRVVPNRLR